MDLHTLLAGLVAFTRADAQKLFLPNVVAFFQAIAADSSALNVTAKLALLNAQILAAGPTLGHDVLAQLAQMVAAEAQALATPAAKS
jgi:hypothetical protein